MISSPQSRSTVPHCPARNGPETGSFSRILLTYRCSWRLPVSATAGRVGLP
jgi:hypothetical protein